MFVLIKSFFEVSEKSKFGSCIIDLPSCYKRREFLVAIHKSINVFHVRSYSSIFRFCIPRPLVIEYIIVTKLYDIR